VGNGDRARFQARQKLQPSHVRKPALVATSFVAPALAEMTDFGFDLGNASPPSATPKIRKGKVASRAIVKRSRVGNGHSTKSSSNCRLSTIFSASAASVEVFFSSSSWLVKIGGLHKKVEPLIFGSDMSAHFL
jgi:hypothetical protein